MSQVSEVENTLRKILECLERIERKLDHPRPLLSKAIVTTVGPTVTYNT